MTHALRRATTAVTGTTPPGQLDADVTPSALVVAATAWTENNALVEECRHVGEALNGLIHLKDARDG